MLQKGWKILKNNIKNFLNNKIIDTFLVTLIIFNVICLGLETDKIIYSNYAHFFKTFELFSIVIFSIEYILRLFALDNIKGLFKPLMLIDLFAILPFYLPGTALDLRFLRMFRLFRILRIFKLARYFEALRMIGQVVYKKRVELLSILGILVFLIFFSSFLMFYAEAEAQPDAFKNILDTFWWSIVTFTTVGYGDVYPVTAIGKLLSAIIVLIGIMLFALPTSILTAEFLNLYQEYNNKKDKQNEN